VLFFATTVCGIKSLKHKGYTFLTTQKMHNCAEKEHISALTLKVLGKRGKTCSYAKVTLTDRSSAVKLPLVKPSLNG